MKWLHKLLPSPTPKFDEQVSIWSIGPRDAKTFFRIVLALWLVALARIVYKKSDGWSAGSSGAVVESGGTIWTRGADFALAVLVDFGAVCLATAVVAMLLARTLTVLGDLLMSLYQALVNRFVVPVIEEHMARGREEGLKQGLEEGRERGLEEGIEEGRAAAREEWGRWNERRMAAEREGREFVETPPGA
ncbi:MAG: hypothetical protein OXH09_01215 [Gammaproteobacteria bacterium]|nr:hypothetical protein [Gammaproteobacteria bacterium]